MAILQKCTRCKRTGGYARDHSDKVCARCRNKMVVIANSNKTDK